MAHPTVISRERHADKRWKRNNSYLFAAGDAVAPLVVQELSRACMELPIAFVRSDHGFQLVAVQGLQSNSNLWVSLDGRWLGNYVPAIYRGDPFILANTDGERNILCIREDRALISETEGQPFFDADGKPAQPVLEVLNFLEQVAADRKLTTKVCELLDANGLIQPWNVQVKDDSSGRDIQGLYRVDEVALNALPAEVFEALRQGGALPLVYCQLLSMQHLYVLGQMASRRDQGDIRLPEQNGDLDLDFLANDGMMRYL